MTSWRSDASEHPLFRATVFMGWGLAVGCGATVATGESKSDPHTGVPPTGGSAGTSGAECSPAQWNCDGAELLCRGLWLRKPSGCFCDFSRPRSPVECGAGQTFVCRKATFDENEQPLDPRVFVFGCACAPTTSSCSSTCMTGIAGYADGYFCDDPTSSAGEPADSLLCGCSFVYSK